MTTTQGWYPDPKLGVGLRYWDGFQWTEHVSVSGQQYISPIHNLEANRVSANHIRPEQIKTAEKPKVKIYWSNLLRIRVWWFTFVSPLVILFLLSFVGLPASFAAVLYLPLAALIGFFWMTQQMACRRCGTVLRVTRLTGGQEVCQKCQHPTDKQIAGEKS